MPRGSGPWSGVATRNAVRVGQGDCDLSAAGAISRPHPRLFARFR
jgi:hypothetical protein